MAEDNVSVEEFQQHIRRDSNLPQNIGNVPTLLSSSDKLVIEFFLFSNFSSDNILLQRYLNVYDNKDIKKSFELLKYNLTTRISGSHIFFNRDPLDTDTQTAAKTALV